MTRHCNHLKRTSTYIQISEVFRRFTDHITPQLTCTQSLVLVLELEDHDDIDEELDDDDGGAGMVQRTIRFDDDADGAGSSIISGRCPLSHGHSEGRKRERHCKGHS